MFRSEVSKTQLTDKQIQEINRLIEHNILEVLCDICEPDMSDIKEENVVREEIQRDRANVLYSQAIRYIKNNL